MPYTWQHPDPAPDAPRLTLTLWPHRSLTPEGFVLFIAVSFTLLLVPVLAHLGRSALWVMLPFELGALALAWVLIRRHGRQAERLRETLTLWPDRAELVRLDPGGRRREWSANPYWVRVVLHKDGGPVENYLTLKGGDREVEIGAFLSPEERIALKAEIEDALRAA